MKDRFSTLDLFAVMHDLKSLENLRVSNIYDVNSKTYLIKFQHPGKKCYIIFESGMRIHVTNMDWPKAQFPSSFSMKLRKHIKQKRLFSVRQLGIDRIVDMQFGTEEFANHIIIELYDRGNIVLTDYEYTILNVLRPRTDVKTDAKIVGKEKYPVQNARQDVIVPDSSAIEDVLKAAKDNELLRRVLSSITCYGPALLEHCLIDAGFEKDAKAKAAKGNLELLSTVYVNAHSIFNSIRKEKTKGYLTVIEQNYPDGSVLKTYEGFYPYKFLQHASTSIQVYDSFSDCLEQFFSHLESQKVDRKALSAEREAIKKLENVRKDHEERIHSLTLSRSEKEEMAYLIVANQETIDQALLFVRSAIANQMTWEEIKAMLITACKLNDPFATMITDIDLNSNSVTVVLSDPHDHQRRPKSVTIDIGLSAYQNAQKLYDQKKTAADKEKRIMESSEKALKSATQKTEKLLKTVRLKSDIVKIRTPMWFEKFYWFISSEGYLVIGGRNAQQNELLVKRYLRPGDIYVHADVRGSASIVVRNGPGKGEIPRKTLNEAGAMATCYSSLWEEKIPVSSWWVHHNQVSRTAPTGEYLSTGSFMIRGKKTFICPQRFEMGLGVLFKLDDTSLERHQEEMRDKSDEVNADCNIRESIDQENIVNDTDEKLELNTEDLVLGVVDSGNNCENNNHSNNPGSNTDGDLDEFPDVKISVDDIIQSARQLDEEFTILQIGPEEKPARDKQNHPIHISSDSIVSKSISEQKKKERPLTKRAKHKALKINKKYRDQDDEEREIRLLLLGSKPKEVQNAKITSNRGKPEIIVKKSGSSTQENDECDKMSTSKETQRSDNMKTLPAESVEEDDEEKDLMFTEDDTKMINSLTWWPSSEDTLLYAIVVVAPYNVIQKFKYKVKLLPGNEKRGKAVKNALVIFQKNKDASAQELALIRVLTADDQIIRNVPGRVRLCAKQSS